MMHEFGGIIATKVVEILSPGLLLKESLSWDVDAGNVGKVVAEKGLINLVYLGEDLIVFNADMTFKMRSGCRCELL